MNYGLFIVFSDASEAQKKIHCVDLRENGTIFELTDKEEHTKNHGEALLRNNLPLEYFFV